MQDDFEKLNEIFGVTSDADNVAKRPVNQQRIKPLEKLDGILYDPDKHEDGDGDHPYEPEERDYRPIRGRRDGSLGCLGGLMYFVFVVSISIILACVGWMAASDVLALNKEELTATVTLPESIFSQVMVDVEDDDGKVTGQKEASSADMEYVARILKDNGIIEYPALFKLFCKISHADLKLDPGTYTLTTDYDYRALVKKMQLGGGAMVATRLTFPEGYSMEQIFAKLEDNGICDKEDLYDAAATYVYKYTFLENVPEGASSRLEGFLFPDTYDFYQGMQASSAINKFLTNFHNKLTADMYKQAENLGLTLAQAVVVASMVEKEAANDDERANIASVIYNRLAAGMPLGIDATSLYTHQDHEGAPTQEMLDDASDPYNTRINVGLPPTPICNPGIASLRAALQPARTYYTYYALDTATGTHKFFSSKWEFDAFVATQDYSGS